jgi:hypothetical protein
MKSTTKRQMRQPRTITPDDLYMITEAVNCIARARSLLKYAGATQARAYAARALKSAKGAQRHAKSQYNAQQRMQAEVQS